MICIRKGVFHLSEGSVNFFLLNLFIMGKVENNFKLETILCNLSLRDKSCKQYLLSKVVFLCIYNYTYTSDKNGITLNILFCNLFFT